MRVISFLLFSFYSSYSFAWTPSAGNQSVNLSSDSAGSSHEEICSSHEAEGLAKIRNYLSYVSKNSPTTEVLNKIEGCYIYPSAVNYSYSSFVIIDHPDCDLEYPNTTCEPEPEPETTPEDCALKTGLNAPSPGARPSGSGATLLFCSKESDPSGSSSSCEAVSNYYVDSNGTYMHELYYTGNVCIGGEDRPSDCVWYNSCGTEPTDPDVGGGDTGSGDGDGDTGSGGGECDPTVENCGGSSGGGFGSPESGENPWDSIFDASDKKSLQIETIKIEREIKEAISQFKNIVSSPNLSTGGSMPNFNFTLSHAGGSTEVNTSWLNTLSADIKDVILLIAAIFSFMIVMTRKV